MSNHVWIVLNHSNYVSKSLCMDMFERLRPLPIIPRCTITSVVFNMLFRTITADAVSVIITHMLFIMTHMLFVQMIVLTLLFIMMIQAMLFIMMLAVNKYSNFINMTKLQKFSICPTICEWFTLFLSIYKFQCLRTVWDIPGYRITSVVYNEPASQHVVQNDNVKRAVLNDNNKHVVYKDKHVVYIDDRPDYRVYNDDDQSRAVYNAANTKHMCLPACLHIVVCSRIQHIS